jgi:hypothetical protein
VSAMTSNPDPAVGDECWMTGLYMAVRGGRRSLDLLAARSLPKVVTGMWKVHRL